MNANELRETLIAMIGARRPVCIEGAPGIGKTRIVHQVADHLGLPAVQYHVPTKLPEDFGVPFDNSDGRTFGFRVPGDMPVEGSPCSDRGVIILDELASGSPDMQKLAANLIQEREIHGHRLKEGWTLVATMNRVEDRAGASPLLTHLANRMTRLSLRAEVEPWCDWASENGIDARILAFLRWMPKYLCDFRPDRDINATPRSWAEGVNTSLRYVPPSLLAEAVQGDVGAVSVDFMAFLDLHTTLPSREEWLRSPKEVMRKLGNPDIGMLYALASMLMDDQKTENFPAYMGCAAELPTDIGAMVFVAFVRKTPRISIDHPEIYNEAFGRYRGIVA